MSTAGEAAALFGSDSDDPFALAFDSNTNNSNGAGNLSEAPSAATFFNDAQVVDFSSETTPTSYGTALNGAGYGTNSNWTGSEVQQSYSSGNPTAGGYPSQNGYYGGQSSYETQNNSYGYGNTSNAYDPYAAYAPPAPASTNVSQYAPTTGRSVETYTPYAPAKTQTTNSYDPYGPNSHTSTAQSTYQPAANPYDPYAPSASHTYDPPPVVASNAQVAYNSYNPQVSPPRESYTKSEPIQTHTYDPPLVPSVPLTTKSIVEAPPTPSVTAFRPKTFDAYDPPLPPPKPVKLPHHHVPPPSVPSPYISQQPIVSQLPPQPVLSPPPPPRSRAHTRPPVDGLPHRAAPPSMASGYPPPASPYLAAENYHHQNVPPVQDRYTPSLPPLPPPHEHHATVPNSDYTHGVNGSHGHAPADFASTNGYALPHTEVHPYTQTSTSDISSPPTQVASYVNGGAYPGTAYEDTGLATQEPGLLFNSASAYEDPTHSTMSPRVNGEPVVDDHAHDEQTPLAQTTHSVPPPQPLMNPQRSPERIKSPPSVPASSPKRQSFDNHPVRRGTLASSPPQVRRGSPLSIMHNAARTSYDPPLPPAAIPRTASPASLSVHSIDEKIAPVRDPYAPLPYNDNSARNRSMSSSSNLSLASTSARDPYAPSLHVRQSSLKQTPYQAPSVQNRIPADSIPAGNYDRTGAQTLSVASRVMQTPYAPSPSLLGTNDPLGRTSVRVPVVSFGFGGKLVTCFHGTPSLNTGFDVALSARQSTDVQVRLLHQTIPESALDTSAASFPGPLFSDPGSPSTSIVRTGAATQAKSKKAKVIKYLEDRASEISKGISYLSSESVEGKRSESKLILVGLLKVMVENDGKLSGSSQIDAAVRAALVSQSSPTDSSSDSLHTAVALSYPRKNDSQSALSDLASTSYSSLSLPIHDSTDYDIAVHTLRSSHLDKIQSLLVRGERRAAFQYAADEKLWAHAMVIASSIDKDAWKEVVAEFVRSELEDKDTVTSAPGKSIGRPSHGKEALRVAYSLFAGSGAAAVQELSPPKLLSSLQVPPPPQALSVTPMTPSFPAPTQTYPIPPHVLAKWTEAAAMMISSPMSLDTSSALTALGDQLAANNWIEAAHACYLLSPQTSPLGGVGSPSARVLLFGASNPSVAPSFWKDPDPIIFSEVVEYALSLTPSAKGQEPFTGLPHLQAYKLIRAASLAEMGHDQLANRYCDAISSSISRPSPYIHAILVGQLKLLTERLVAAPQMDKSGSWIGSKMTRPSLDKIGNWLEGRLKDFIAGDGESPVADNTQPKDRTFSGPFAHYSTISSASSSTHASPQQSMMDLAEVDTPPYRTGSAMALRPSNPAHVQINRASSAMDYIRRKASPIPRVSSASATAPTFGDATPFRNFGNSSLGLTPYGNTPPKVNEEPNEEAAASNSQGDGSAEDSSSGPQIASWWGASESTAPTPTATSFVHLDSGVPAVASEGFISLMDDPALSVPPSAPPRTPSSFAASHSIPQSINEEDDLGLGNSTSRAQRAGDANAAVSNTPEPAKSTPELEKTADSKAAPSAGWFSRLWKRESGPVKANLGEQTSFYYDENLKRWVNKNAGAQDSKPSAPPPPPRAQTASPGTASSRMYGGPSPAPAPPTRPATTSIDLSDSPPRKPPIRVRSNLIPSETSSAPATPATATTPMNGSPMDGPPGLDGPPPPGARARAHAKKNVRSRYVDVFQQP